MRIFERKPESVRKRNGYKNVIPYQGFERAFAKAARLESSRQTHTPFAPPSGENFWRNKPNKLLKTLPIPDIFRQLRGWTIAAGPRVGPTPSRPIGNFKPD